MEKNCDALAVRLWTKACPEVDHLDVVNEVLDRRLGKHLRDLPVIGPGTEFGFDPDYSYQRVETVTGLLRAVVNEGPAEVVGQ